MCKLNGNFAGGGKEVLQNQKRSCWGKCVLSTQLFSEGFTKKHKNKKIKKKPSQDSVRTINISRKRKTEYRIASYFPQNQNKASNKTTLPTLMHKHALMYTQLTHLYIHRVVENKFNNLLAGMFIPATYFQMYSCFFDISGLVAICTLHH